MILSCNNISKAFLDKDILCQASFYIEDREKAAIVGINGAGKSTLLKIITGDLAADEGQVVLSRGRTMGYLAQHQDINDSHSIYEALLEVKKEILALEEKIRLLEKEMPLASGDRLKAMMESYAQATQRFEEAGGYALQSEVTGVLKGLGFTPEDFSRPVSALSGGQKTRVSLGKLLLSKPDIILLDEPTNHLDMNSIAWLETFLLNYPGAVIVVAHDRYFLDRIVTKVIEVDHTRVSVFSGNYSDYAEKKAMLREAQIKAYMNQQAEIRHQEEVIAKLRSFNREKSIKRAESREKMLNKIDRLDKPFEVKADMSVRFTPRLVSGNDVMTIRNLSKAYGSLTLFRNVDMDIRRGERVAVIGNNGTGKTTLLKIINGLAAADTGSVSLGAKVQIGYYDQEYQVLHMEKTLFEEILDEHPSMTNTEIRSLLAAFLFTGDDVFKRVGDLSGGERGRVSLAKLMLSEANFLILDEPTNHLDMVSRDILEKALSQYTGTVLYVSHDRYLVNRTATRILELENGGFVNYLGNYDYYLEKKAALSSGNSTIPGAPGWGRSDTASGGSSAESAVKQDWKAQKEQQARRRKRQNDLARCETEIASLEARSKELQEEMSLPEVATSPSRLLPLTKEQEENEIRLNELYSLWEQLAGEEE
ncbi:MAG: ABC-F family ATP-binding cassette domain-containing protein [Lachnospiraceae bacterium]|nr:ABC-F family ATP-binding cassette domain-containing protein [Lachnospiraceae bacterium]